MGCNTIYSFYGGIIISRVTLLTQSEFFKDPRVLKESISLSDSGFFVSVYCYQYEFDPKYTNYYHNVNIHRIKRDSSNNKTFSDLMIKCLFYVTYSLPIVLSNKIIYRTNMIYFLLKRVFLRLFSSTPYAFIDPIVTGEKISPFIIKYLDYYSVFILSNIELFNKARRSRSDIIHSTDLITLFAGFLLKKYNKNSLLVYDTHELWIDSMIGCPPFIKSLLFYYERFLISRCDLVFTVNESIAHEIVKRYNIPKPITVLNCPHYEKSSNSKTDISSIHILYHGAFIRERGLENIIESMKYLPLNFKLFLRGFDGYSQKPSGGYIDELKSHVSNLSLENRVTFLEPVEMIDLIKNINDFDIGITPYQPTNMNQMFASPNKTFEYMMGGLAVAVSDIPEQRRFVVDNNVGLSFNPDDPKSISDVIYNISKDKLTDMKKRALILSKEKYNWEVQSELFIKNYKKIIESKYR